VGVLDGKVALVTGGSRGIGCAIARALAAAGAKVALTYRAEADAAADVVSEIEEAGGTAAAFALDVRDRAKVKAVLAEVVDAFGGLHIVANNAGINKPTDFDQVTDEDWQEIMDVNLRGPFVVAQEALPHLQAAGGGSIVMTGSVSGQYGGPRTAHYAASKAGLISLAQVIARFGAARNIRCNTVAAGLIASEMAASGMANPAVAKAAATIPLGRLGAADEVAAAVVWLASDAASYVTAQTINVNGGLYF
jgi:NAD(P)-dependent dehydrogenase (short-subunit alcohol dehydrogenase family)